ncbi:MAG: guanylate kinase [Deltaproteobacteria bacterium]|nr:guanylate kinase [Deltaproteobacteria bacterium]
MVRRGIPFVVSAPSGAGKTTLIERVQRELDGLGFSVSHTTRAPRQGEIDGVHYHFTTREDFGRLRSSGAFAESAEVHGNFYGTSYAALEAGLAGGRDLILDIDVQGGVQIRSKVEGAVLVFVVPPSWAALRARLEGRGLDDSEVVERRIQNARREFAQAEHYDYLILNDELSGAVTELASIIRAERCRVERRLPLLKGLQGKQPG